MVKNILMSLILAVSLWGCCQSHSYIEGTSTALGTYIPYDGNIYGAEIVSYLSGCRVITSTNKSMNIERFYTASNSYFGIVHTIEHTKTKVKVD